MATSVVTYFMTSGLIIKYALKHKLPLMGICQGFYNICVHVHDHFENDIMNSKILKASTPCHMKGVSRTVKWAVENP